MSAGHVSSLIDKLIRPDRTFIRDFIIKHLNRSQMAGNYWKLFNQQSWTQTRSKHAERHTVKYTHFHLPSWSEPVYISITVSLCSTRRKHALPDYAQCCVFTTDKSHPSLILCNKAKQISELCLCQVNIVDLSETAAAIQSSIYKVLYKIHILSKQLYSDKQENIDSIMQTK